MTLWLNHTIDERIAMLQRAEEKFRINQVAIEKDWWVTVVLISVKNFARRHVGIFLIQFLQSWMKI